MSTFAELNENQTLFKKYVHFTGITVFRVGSEIFADALWHRDLTHHAYLSKNIVVVCPIVDAVKAPEGYLIVSDDRFQFVHIPTTDTTVRYLLSGFPLRVALKAWQELKDADLAYGAMVEHPMPLGWVVHPIARLRRVLSYVYLESAAWRPCIGVSHTKKYMIKSYIVEILNRLSLRFVSFAFINQPIYQVMIPKTTPFMISPSTWFLPNEAADEHEVRSRSIGEAGLLDCLIASRVTSSKGFRVLFDALKSIEEQKISGLTLTVLGGGDMLDELKSAALNFRYVRVIFVRSVPYGRHFMGFLRQFDLVLIPNLADEQPRIVYDAFSQAIPVLASNTSGVVSVVKHDVNGILIEAGSVQALVRSLVDLLNPERRALLRRMGYAGYKEFRTYNHAEMHRRRVSFFVIQKSNKKQSRSSCW